MKRILSLLLTASIITAVLTGCGKNGEPSLTPSPTSNVLLQDTPTPAPTPSVLLQDTPTPTPASNKIIVGFSQVGADGYWRSAVTTSIQDSCEAADFDLRFVDAQCIPELQVQQLRDFITQGADVISFSPMIETCWDEVVKEINDAGIPLIIIDKYMDIPGTDHYATWIGSNCVEEGEKAAEWLIEYMEQTGRGNDEINIVELQGVVGAYEATDRQKGFMDAIAGKTNFKITHTQTCEFTQALAKTVMDEFLKTGDRIDVVFSHNDYMALGAIEAIKEAGLKPGEDIIVIGMDGTKPAFEAIAAGEMNVTVERSPFIGPPLVDCVNRLAAGETLPKITYTDEYVYDDFLCNIFPDKYKRAVEELPNRKY